jgi:protocatechuate 3,4-dioxygenase beta subunit
LRPGSYGVCFDPAAATGGNAPHGYAPQCLAADPFAPLQPSDHEVVSVSPGATSRGDIALGVRPTLSGTVRGPGGAPLKGATVTITTTGDYDDVAFRATTQADGTYLITWDGNTSDRMCFTPPATVPKDRVCVDEIYGLVSGFRSRTHIDYSFATAPVSSTVVGKVTDAAGHPMGGVTVRPSVGPSSYTTSAKDGTYRLTGLDAVQGDSICFTPSAAVAPASATGYLARCVDGVDHLPGHTVTVDAALHRGGAISGVVTDPRGTPLPGLTVSVGGVDVGGGGYPTTDAYGRYSITGLPPDRYVVGFLADGAYSNQQSWGFYFGGPSVTGYLDECWNDIKPYGDCLPVTVSEGHAVTGLNAALSPAGGVSGTVRDAQGHPLRHVRVDIFTNSYDDYEITDLNGHYTGVRLPLGSYRVCAESEPDTSPRVPLGYTRRCFKDAPDAETGTGVTVTSGRIAPGVDITMQPEPVGSASGRVTDQDGGPLGGVLVNLGGAQTHSRPDGTYDLANVPVGSFAPCFDPPAADGGAPAYVAACGDPVDIAADQSTDVPMEQLVPAGAITGVVRDDQGTPVTGALVSTLADPWAAVPEAHTDADGRYRIAGLAPGDYRLYYGAPTSADFPLESRWAGGGLDSSTALVIHVDSGATEEHDETLSSDGAVTGAVRDSSGTPLPFATVTVAGPNGFAAVTTGADGTYRADVPPGDYSVCFATERSDAAMYGASSSCFGDTGGGAGQPVTVVGRQATSGIDGSLQRYGGYTVHVTDAAGHALAGVEGSVSDPDGNLISWGWRTDGFGSAAGGGLAPGTYVVSLLGYDAVAPDGSTGFGNADLSLTVTAGVGTDLSASLAPE